jgi:hypothetical protein
MQNKTVRGVYERGQLRFAEPVPVEVEGCWRVDVTFIEREDTIPVHADPHSPERLPVPDRLEELHRNLESGKPRTGPI